MYAISDDTPIDPDAIAARIRGELKSSEAAVLALGKIIDQIVSLATDSAGDRTTTTRSEVSFAERINGVTAAAAGFIDEIRLFLRRQADFARAANTAFQRIHETATNVADLTFKSRLLAINLQVEAARGRGPVSAVKVIGQEMVQFSQDIRAASSAIVQSLEGLSKSLPKIETEAVSMAGKANTFAAELSEQLDVARRDVEALRQSQAKSLQNVQGRNRTITSLALRAVSELQFYDPLVQDLLAVLALLGDAGDADHPTPIALASVGRSDPNRRTGVVDLF